MHRGRKLVRIEWRVLTAYLCSQVTNTAVLPPLRFRPHRVPTLGTAKEMQTAAPAAPQADGNSTLSPAAVATKPPAGVIVSATFDGGVADSRTSDTGDADAVQRDEELEEEELTDEDDQLYDSDSSDSEFEEEDQFGDGESAGSKDDDTIQAPVEFLGAPARFAAVESTTGFMLLRAGEDAHDGGEIAVRYRYARFTATGGPGVEVFGGGGAKVHPVRFLVPARAADPVSSLRLAGAAMADMVYPPRFAAQLRALWTNLVAAAPVRVPPGTARVEVTVSVGILRPGDRTPERMVSMRAALVDTAAREAGAGASWPFLSNSGAVMRLPAPVMRVEEDDGARPAKRRKFAVVEDEVECAICYEVMERGLEAWPLCEHVFHGKCLEQLLVWGDHRCPMCRTELNTADSQLASASREVVLLQF